MPPPPRLLIPVLSASNFLIGMGAFVIVGLLEPLGSDLGVAPTQAGLMLTVYALAYALLSPLLVSLTGSVGRRRVLTIALLLFMLAAALSAAAPGMATLYATRIIAAAGAGMFTPVAAAVAAAVYPPDRRARVLASVFFGLTLSQVAGVPVGSWIAYTFGWRWAFGLVVVLALPCIALIWRCIPGGLAFQPVSLRDLGEVMRNGRMMLAVLFTTTFLGASYVVFTFIAPLLSEAMGYGRDGVSLALLTSGIGAVVGTIIGGIVTDRLGWRATLSILCLLQMVLMPLFSALPLPDAWVMLLCFCWSASSWPFMAAQQMRLISVSGAQAPVTLALNAAAIYVGAALGSALGAWVIDLFGLRAIGIAGGLCGGLALLHLTVSASRPPQGHVGA